MQVPQVSVADTEAAELPDAPSAVAPKDDVVTVAETSFKENGGGVPNCTILRSMRTIRIVPDDSNKLPGPCSELINPYQRFLDMRITVPLSWEQKGYLALHGLTDPSNVLTIVGISAINVGVDSHTAYGPGLKGFGKIAGVSLLQDATGEFFGTFAIPSLTHQDPRYFRMRKGSIPRRIGHAVSQTYAAYADNGRRMPNYGTLLAFPIDVELSNLYVPGIESDGPSTAKRIATGWAIDPVNNLVAEFLPDVASRVHIRIIFVQNILNNIAAANSAGGP
jgi:hypothetical protein